MFPGTINNINESNNTNNIINILNQNAIRQKPRFHLELKSNCNFSNDCLESIYKFKKKTRKRNKDYMYTPCHHVFHKECLEKWFLLKKECPNCRNDLSDLI